jgi:hypothetical protein
LKPKNIAQHIFVQEIFDRWEFSTVDAGPFISCSIHKYAATHVRQFESREKKDMRGSWKGRGRVSGIYDDNKLSIGAELNSFSVAYKKWGKEEMN